jgi:hypothetical protein
MSDLDQRVAALRGKVHGYLSRLVGEVRTDAAGRFVFSEGSAQVVVSCEEWPEVDNTVVRLTAPVVLRVPPDPEVFRFVATHGNDFAFARLWVEEAESGELAVFAGWTLVGDDLDPAEMMAAARIVAVAADHLDDQLKERFGGVTGDALELS